MAASENLSEAAILIFRRYFGSSSLSRSYKTDVLKTSVKFTGNTYVMSESLFNKVANL